MNKQIYLCLVYMSGKDLNVNPENKNKGIYHFYLL